MRCPPCPPSIPVRVGIEEKIFFWRKAPLEKIILPGRGGWQGGQGGQGGQIVETSSLLDVMTIKVSPLPGGTQGDKRRTSTVPLPRGCRNECSTFTPA